MINNLGLNLLVCSDGVVSHLQDAIQTLVSDGNIIPRSKEILVQQLVINFVQDTKLCSSGMEVHYVNAFINCFSDDLGLNKQPHEKTVTTDNSLVQQHVADCWKSITKKLPVALVSYLSEELCLAGRLVLKDGQFIDESWQHFSTSPLVKFFESDNISITQALFVQDEESGRYAVLTHSDSLHGLVARHLMSQEWLQHQEPQYLMDHDGGAVYTLADYGFYWQSKENGNNQRPLTAEELLKLSSTITQAPQLELRMLELAANQGFAEAQFALAEFYSYDQRDKKNEIYYYRLAAKQGHFRAQYRLALLLESDLAKNKVEVIQLYELAASQGHTMAQQCLWRMLKPQNKNEEPSESQIQFDLGRLYFRGQGVEENDKLVVYYYELAAKQGHVESQFALAEMYMWGTGVETNRQQAIHYYKLAANQGHAKSQITLGTECYCPIEDEYMDDKNLQQAIYYLKLAEKQGHSRAKAGLRMIYREIEEDKARQQIQGIYNNGEQITLSDHATLAEAMVSLDGQEQVIQRIATEQSGFSDSRLDLPSFNGSIEDQRKT